MESMIKVIPMADFDYQDVVRKLRQGYLVRIKGSNTSPPAIEMVSTSLNGTLKSILSYQEFHDLAFHNYATSTNAYYNMWFRTIAKYKIVVEENEEAVHLLVKEDPFLE